MASLVDSHWRSVRTVNLIYSSFRKYFVIDFNWWTHSFEWLWLMECFVISQEFNREIEELVHHFQVLLSVFIVFCTIFLNFFNYCVLVNSFNGDWYFIACSEDLSPSFQSCRLHSGNKWEYRENDICMGVCLSCRCV